jgi:hypothetical protein
MVSSHRHLACGEQKSAPRVEDRKLNRARTQRHSLCFCGQLFTQFNVIAILRTVDDRDES